MTKITPIVWPLTEVQSGFLNDGAQALVGARRAYEQRVNAAFVEAAKTAGLDPQEHKATLIVLDGGKLAFRVEKLNRADRRQLERQAAGGDAQP